MAPAAVRRELGAAMGRVSERHVQTPATMAALNEAIRCAATLRLCADPLEMQIIDAGPPFGERVVSFCPPKSGKASKDRST
jgi:hypothetical protein